MPSFTTIVVSSLIVLNAVLAAPLNGPASGHPGNNLATPPEPAHPQAFVAAHSGLLPRVLSRRTDGSLPIGHRPSDLGADNATPRRNPENIMQRQEVTVDKRHDHINSPNVTTTGSCNVGQAQCCQSIHQSTDKQADFISSLLGIVIPGDNSMIGLQCTPIANLLSVTGSSTCNSKPICCSGNEYDGLVNVGCSPISANS